MDPTDMSPSLGGHRSAPDDGPTPGPEPEAPPETEVPADGAWRFDFRFNVDLNLSRVFDWSWSSEKKDP